MRSDIEIVTARACAGSGPRESLDSLISEAVEGALDDAGYALDSIDSVVGSGSDADDGGLSPLLRSAPAGGYGKEYLHMTGSSGQALAAGRSLLGAGLAQRCLVVAWCPAAKDAVLANQAMTADPFYARAVGANPASLRSLQADALRQCGIAIDTAPENFDTFDQACAVVLERCAEDAGRHRGLHIEGCGLNLRDFFPSSADLDPAGWIADTMLASGATRDERPDEVLLVSAPGGGASRAREILASQWQTPPKIATTPPSGGSASALARLAELRNRQSGGAEVRKIWLLEMDGPLGQALSLLRLREELRL